ncbi:MAG TPA: hypothetical protein VMQ65_02945 [Candidatus Limnocylindria bacterium]|nr:hypothetical protein [Candidatus Limnocylindria bacterium]
MRQPIGSMWAARQPRVRVPTPDRAIEAMPHHRPRGRHGLSSEQEAIVELQSLAGNGAVAWALAEGRAAGRVTSVDAIELTREGMPPADGVTRIREQTSNKLTIALTQRGIRDEPPIMRTQPPEKGKDGYTARTRKVGSIEEPMIHEWWPKDGRHELTKGSFLDVDHDWEEKLRDGEDEHGRDARVAWELTWKKVQDTINSFAEKPGPPAPSPEAATKALWRRYVKALPTELQPAGDMPNDAKQRDVLAVRPGTFFAWMWEATVARDQRGNHSTKTVPAMSPKNAPKGAMVNTIAALPDFKVPGKSSEDFVAELRAKWAPGKIIQGSKLKAGDETGKDG